VRAVAQVKEAGERDTERQALINLAAACLRRAETLPAPRFADVRLRAARKRAGIAAEAPARRRMSLRYLERATRRVESSGDKRAGMLSVRTVRHNLQRGCLRGLPAQTVSRQPTVARRRVVALLGAWFALR
jgi:hypothetical protein